MMIVLVTVSGLQKSFHLVFATPSSRFGWIAGLLLGDNVSDASFINLLLTNYSVNNINCRWIWITSCIIFATHAIIEFRNTLNQNVDVNMLWLVGLLVGLLLSQSMGERNINISSTTVATDRAAADIRNTNSTSHPPRVQEVQIQSPSCSG